MTSNQNTTEEADDVVVDNVEDGISNEEANQPTNADDTPETNDNKTNQTSAAEDEVSPTLPWWKQKRVLIIGIVVLVIIVVVAIVLGVTLSSSNNKCFGADDGGENGILNDAVRSYVDQNCANNEKCEIGQTYGWPMNSWCVDNVKSMRYLFENMDTFNEDINGWNTSSVTDMRSMFRNAEAFNQDLSNFDTSKVTSMYGMFWEATSFNGDVSKFDTSKVTDMGGMFYYATAFNQDVSSFDLSSVTSLYYMFEAASSFNRDLCSWRDSFPYTNAVNIFTDSGCTYQDTPNKTQKGPFCASNCQ